MLLSTLKLASTFLACVSAQVYQTYTFNGVAVGPNDGGNSQMKYVWAGTNPNYGSIPGMYYNWQGLVMNGDRQVYIIYYYDSWKSQFPNSSQKSIIEDFIRGISFTSYYNTAKKYYYQFGHWSPREYLGNLRFGTLSTPVVRVDCRSGDGVGCYLSPQNDISTIIQKQIYKTSGNLGGKIWRARTGQWINNNQALYIVISAPEIPAQYGLSKTLTAGIDFCSYHSSFWSQADAEYFAYAFVPFPRDKCILKIPGAFPNGDAQTDSLISYLNHEVIETLIQPVGVHYRSWTDNVYLSAIEVMDKCQGFMVDLKKDGTSTRIFNIQVGSRKYLVTPIFDWTANTCRMS